MNCPKCNDIIAETDLFCGSCGVALKDNKVKGKNKIKISFLYFIVLGILCIIVIKILSEFIQNIKSIDDDPKANIFKSEIVTEGLIAYYPFNGNTQDESKNKNHLYFGAQNPTFSLDRFNKYSAYYFDWKTRFSQINSEKSFDLSGGYTISLWIKIIEPGYSYMFLSLIGEYSNINLQYLPQRKKINFKWGYGANGIDESKQSLEISHWYHLVVLAGPDKETSLYIDGNLDSKNGVSGWGLFNNSKGLQISVGELNNYNYFKGYIDDIRIYNRTLYESEIRLLFNQDGY